MGSPARPRLAVAVSLAAAAALAVLAVAGRADAAVRGPEARDPARFAADALALHEVGYHLRDLSVTSDPEGLVVVTFTLADATSAVRLELEFADWGDRVVAYTRAPGDVSPDEARVYPFEQELFAALVDAPVTRLYDECGARTLMLGDTPVSLWEDDWYVVAGRWTGADAGPALARELRGALAAGWDVSSVYHAEEDSNDGAPRHVVIGLAKDDRRTLFVELDDEGAVLSVERRDAPLSWEAGRMAGRAKTAKALGRVDSITRVDVEETDAGVRLVLVPAKGKGKAKAKKVVLDSGAIEYPEEEGCGC
jgi:hypothetical protein